MSPAPRWKTVSLEEAAEIVVGQSPPGSTYNESKQGLPFFQGAGEFGELYPEVRKWTTHEQAKRARKNAVLLSVRAPVGPTNLAPTDCAIGRGLVAVHASESFDQRFLLWALRHLASELARVSSGSTFASVRSGQVRELQVPAPPLEEQRAIVDAIERMLSLVDAATEDTTRGLSRARVLRRSALADAFVRHETDGDGSADHLDPLEAEWRSRRPETGRGAGRDPEPYDTDEELPAWRWPVVSLDALSDPSRPICYGILKPRVEVRATCPTSRSGTCANSRYGRIG